MILIVYLNAIVTDKYYLNSFALCYSKWMLKSLFI